MGNNVGVSVDTKWGTCRFTLSYSYSDCGLAEISYLNCSTYVAPRNKPDFYRAVLDYIKRGEFQYTRPDGQKVSIYKAIVHVSDRVRTAGETSIYDMMTRYAPAFKKDGVLKFTASPVVRNPNSGNKIRQWSIACDGYKARYGGRGIY